MPARWGTSASSETSRRCRGPIGLAEAEDFLARRQTADGAFCLIHEHDRGAIRLVGGIGVHPCGDGFEFGYWLTPSAWGRGIATEAGRGMLRAARESLRLRRLHSAHFVDNPASGRVLRKLGFRPTGRVEPRHCVARGTEMATATFEIELCSVDADNDPGTRMAA